MALHRPDPLRVDNPGAHHPGGLLGQAPHPGPGGVGGVAEPGLGLHAGDGPDRRDHPAVVLQVVIGIEDVVLAVVLVLDRDLDRGEPAAHRLGSGQAHPGAPVGPAAPRLVDGGEIGVGTPVPGLEEREDARAVRSGLRAEDPRVVAEPGQVEGLIQQPHDVGEGVTEEPRDPERDVHPGTAQLALGHELQATDPPRLLLPHGSHADQRERLGDVVAHGPHGRRAPQHEPDAAREGTLLLAVALDQGVRQLATDLPRQGGGHRLGVDGVEVAAGRQHVGHSPASGHRSVRTAHGVRRALATPRRSRRWSAATTARAGRRPTAASDPRRRNAIPAAWRLSSTRRFSASTRSTSALERAGSWGSSRPSRAGTLPWGSRVMARTRSTSARPPGGTPRTCKPPRICASLSSHR